MFKRAIPVLALAASAALVAACQDTVGTGADLSVQETEDLIDAMIATSFGVTEAAAMGDATTTDGNLLVYGDAITSHTEFVTTRTCALGGQVVIEGTRDREWDRDTHSGSSDLALTKTHEECRRTLRRRDVVVTLTGAPNVAVEAHRAWRDGEPTGLQTLSMQGGFDWSTDDGRTGTCLIDLEVTFDPESRTRTVVGQLCNRTIERTTTWNHGG